jgi:tetratricopeptide (TPR) repeat protein
MGSVSRLALAALLGFGALSLVAVAPADAKKREEPTGPRLTQQERSTLAALDSAIAGRNYAAAGQALSAAQAAATGSDAKWYVANLQLKLARETNNIPMQSAAINALLASGRVPQSELADLYYGQASIAAASGQRDRAEAAYTKALELSSRPDVALELAQLKISRGKEAEGIALLDRAATLRRASGQAVPESWYRRALSIATVKKLSPQALKFSRDLVTAYPTAENWRDAILLYRDYATPDAATTLDLWRLMRMSHALAGERDYMEAAQAFSTAGLHGESRSLFDEAVAAKMVDPAKPTFKEAIASAAKGAPLAKAKLASLRTAAAAAPTGGPSLEAADQSLSFGDYAGAIEFYRSALQKGGVDADTANTRLGIALALAGRKPEAETAFRAVAGARAQLATLWLVWLGQHA